MDNHEIGQYVKIGGIVVGALTVVVFVVNHPVPIILLGVGAAMYFVGEYLQK